MSVKERFSLRKCKKKMKSTCVIRCKDMCTGTSITIGRWQRFAKAFLRNRRENGQRTGAKESPCYQLMLGNTDQVMEAGKLLDGENTKW